MKACIICGCTEISACTTEGRPCAWSLLSSPETPICTACEDKAHQIHLAVDLFENLPF